VRQVANQELRLARDECVLQALEHRVLDCAAADRTQRTAVLTQQEPCARPLRRRPRGTHDGGQSAALTARQQLEQSLNDIAHGK
jgi:hypothetical protein